MIVIYIANPIKAKIRLSKNRFIAVRRGFDFAGKPYGICQIVSRGIYTLDRERK